MKKLNILQVFPAFNTGGVEEGALAISNALQKAGHQSFIASSGGSKVDIALQNGARHFQIEGLSNKNPLLLYSSVQELARIIKTNNIDIVHARSRWPAWIAYLACKQTKTRYLTTFHGAHNAQNIFKRTYNSIMVRTRHVISISEYLSDYIRKNYANVLKSYKTQIHTINRGIDVKRYDPATINQEDIAALKKEWDLQEGNKVVLLPARLTRLKGHDVLIKALTEIDASNLQVICVGAQPQDDPKYREELEQLIQDLGLSQTVKIVPSISNMPAAYMLADAVVFPSTRPEAFGRIVIEAQAMGVPIITANIGAQATLIDHGISGWLFNNEDPSCLGEQIKHVLNLPLNVRQLYAENMRKKIVDSFSQEVMASKTFEVYAMYMKEDVVS